MTHPRFKVLKSIAAGSAEMLLIVLGLTVAQAENCPITNSIKWAQLPDRHGLDVLAAQPSVGAAGQPLILADDFLCNKSGPISDIHVWASWLGDTPDPTIPITLTIWSDVPPVAGSPSHPGSVVWRQTFTQYEICPVGSAPDEQFWNPDPPPGLILGPDHIIWQYNFYPTDPFVQQGSPGNAIVYWLSVSAGTNRVNFGWKTAVKQWNDAAVYGHVLPDGINAVGDWQPLYDPRSPGNATRLDLAFALTTPETHPPPPLPPAKWVQYPDTNGFDVNITFPNIVADDFLCTNSCLLTNIQIWASWQADATPDRNTTITLSIWDDVPPGSSTGLPNGPSHPKSPYPLWTETFGPGTYTFVPAGSGNELFYSPTTGQLTPESKIWLYNFNPKRPFCQKGTANHHIIYWLSVQAQTPAGTAAGFGWKTSTNHWNDDAVYGHLTAAGPPLGDWIDLHDPRVTTAPVSLDMAFLINNGPPCDNTKPPPKWVQGPDTTPNGLDVLANYSNILADDFLCRITEPISRITVWGSWLNDLVDPTAAFQLSLWTDVPGTAANPVSHPGQLLCSTIFFPSNAIGTSLQRYNVRLDQANLSEHFYDPNLLPPGGIIGTDTRLYRYDFYPFYPGCWIQYGSSFTTGPSGGQIYWLALSALLSNPDQYKFGWKTSTNHNFDDAVFGHFDSTGTPLKDWQELFDPRTTPKKSLDLAFALRSFPVTGINKDLKNTTTQTAIGVQIVLAGHQEILWHYDDSPAYPIFQTYDDASGNTVLQWSGKTVAPGTISHVGFEMQGTGAPVITSINWLTATGVSGPIAQGCFHFLGNASSIVVNNCIFPAAIIPMNGTIEFFDTPPGLDQMIPTGQRTPLVSFPLPVQPMPLMPGGAMRIPVPAAPSNARYAMLMMNLADPTGAPATMDFVLVPLDMALRPMIQDADLMGGNLNLRFMSIPDRMYNVQATPDLRSSFFDIFTDIAGNGEEIVLPIPTGASQGFYRVVLQPE